jgi:hypothetical protein
MPPTKRQDDAPFRIGELVQVEIAGDWLFEQPQPIRRIETGPDGARWYFFAGSTSSLPEHCLRAIESQKPDRVAGVDHFSETSGKREPFCRFPNEVMRDKRLGVAARVLAAYQATFVGAYTLNTTSLRRRPIVRAGKSGTRLGRNVIERANRELRAAGYKKRWQPLSTGKATFSKAIDKLTLPPCGASGKAGRIVYRKWFDAQLSLNEMGAYLYFRAGTGRGPIIYASELADTFGWSRPTAAKAITALIKIGLVNKREMREANGQIRRAGYEAMPPVLWQNKQGETASKSRGMKHRGAKHRGTKSRGTRWRAGSTL